MLTLGWATVALRALLLAITIIGLGGCTTAPPVHPVWEFYDGCTSLTSSFVEMVACGKKSRMDYCQPKGTCGALGTAFVQYADALATQVTNHEIKESEAIQRFAQYKTQVISDAHRDQVIVESGRAAAAAAAAASGPKTCTTYGNVTNCF